MHANGDINLGQVGLLVEHLIRDKVAGLYVCGSTGEGPSLTIAERKAVAETYIQCVAGRLPVIIQVGHESLRHAQELAEHAQAIGADAISAVPPHFFKPHTLEVLLKSLREITNAAPELPFYYYHIPRLTAIPIDVRQLLILGVEQLPNLRGVKYSNFTIFELQACANLEVNGVRFNLLFGSDEMLLSGLVGGAHGAVGSTYNFAAPLYKRIISAYQKGDLTAAQYYQGLSVKMIQPINHHSPSNSNLAAIKAVMKLIGLDCGPLRLPNITLSENKIEQLRVELESIGFFNWARSP
jgi:N-acetylneuraminate lyase